MLFVPRPAFGAAHKKKRGLVMVRKIITATASAALCLASVSPALAQNYAFSGFDAPRGATATANFRVPLGKEKAKPTYGLTFGYGQTVGSPSLDGRTVSRGMEFADFRFDGKKVAKANVMSFDLANLDKDRRLNMADDGSVSTGVIVVGVIALGAAVCLILADCFDDDDDDDEDSD
jgi:hypothetical protein